LPIEPTQNLIDSIVIEIFDNLVFTQVDSSRKQISLLVRCWRTYT